MTTATDAVRAARTALEDLARSERQLVAQRRQVEQDIAEREQAAAEAGAQATAALRELAATNDPGEADFGRAALARTKADARKLKAEEEAAQCRVWLADLAKQHEELRADVPRVRGELLAAQVAAANEEALQAMRAFFLAAVVFRDAIARVQGIGLAASRLADLARAAGQSAQAVGSPMPMQELRVPLLGFEAETALRGHGELVGWMNNTVCLPLAKANEAEAAAAWSRWKPA